MASANSPKSSGKGAAAVIGLGSMGAGMAASMLRAGFDVVGFDVSPASLERFVGEGGRAAATPAEAARGAAIVVSVVVNAVQTEAILFGTDSVAAAMPEGSAFISSATMDPEVARRLGAQLESSGRHYLDAPISGGAARAAKGELTILASGSPAAFARARPAPNNPWRSWRLGGEHSRAETALASGSRPTFPAASVTFPT